MFPFFQMPPLLQPVSQNQPESYMQSQTDMSSVTSSPSPTADDMVIDEKQLKKHEGFKTDFYVPLAKTRTVLGTKGTNSKMEKRDVAGASGVTIAGGIDLGQQKEKDFDWMLEFIPEEKKESVKESLRPFLGLRKKDALAELANQKVKGNIGIDEDTAKALQQATEKQYKKRAFEKYFDTTGNFITNLDPIEQQVLFEMNYQGLKKFDAVANALANGNLLRAIDILQKHPQRIKYSKRINDYIKSLKKLQGQK